MTRIRSYPGLKLFYLSLFTSFYITASGLAQTLRVLDNTTLEPIAGVQISGNNLSLTSLTNSLGQADFNQFQKADSLQFRLFGYKTEWLAVKLIQNQNYKILLSASSLALPEVVVSATRFAEKRENIPQQTQVLSRQQLQFMSQPTTADVLGQTGNIMVQKSQLGGGSPIIRGFEANKVLLVVDGVRLNNTIYRGGHLQNSLTLDNAVLEKVEIVFGPGSVMYGSDALGGVMHFYTRQPNLSGEKGKISTQINAFTRYASAARENTGHTNFNLGGQKWASFSAITYSDFDDLRQGRQRRRQYPDFGKRTFYVERVKDEDVIRNNELVNIQKKSGYHQYDVLQKILFQPDSSRAHWLNLQYSTSSDIPRYDRLTQTRNNIPRFAEWYYGPQTRLLTSYNFRLNKVRKWFNQANIIGAYQYVAESRHDRNFQENDLHVRQEKLHIYSINADFAKEIKLHEFRYGLEVTSNMVHSSAFAQDILSREMAVLDTRYPDGGSGMQTAAVYLTHAYKIKPNLILNEGIRYSYTRLQARFRDKRFFPFPIDQVIQQNRALNGNLGLVWHPVPSWRLNLLAATGFRAPNVDDLSKVFESVPGQVILPNPTIKPEKTYNLEVGLGKTLAEKVRIEAVGFYTRYHDAITVQPTTFQGQDSIFYNNIRSRVTTSTNAQQAYIYGSSLTVRAAISPALAITTSLNYTFGRLKTDTTDYPLDHIPPVFGQTDLQIKLTRFHGSLVVVYHGWKRPKDYNLIGEDNFAFATADGMPAWYTLNLRTAYRFSKNIQLQVALENILDRNYRVFASNISAPGRNLILTLRGTI